VEAFVIGEVHVRDGVVERQARIEYIQSKATSMTKSNEPQLVKVKVSQTPSPWFGNALKRISELTGLAEGWDGYGAHKIDAELAVDAVAFLTQVAYPGIAEPSIVPLPDGGLQVEWHRNGVDVEVAFSDEDPGVYVAHWDSGAIAEYPVARADAEVERVLEQLRA
jgi:hypothetical protein